MIYFTGQVQLHEACDKTMTLDAHFYYPGAESSSQPTHHTAFSFGCDGHNPNEAARRRPRDLDTGVHDGQSASPRLLAASASSRAQGPERAVKASDLSKSSRVLRSAEIQADRRTPVSTIRARALLIRARAPLPLIQTTAHYPSPTRTTGVPTSVPSTNG